MKNFLKSTWCIILLSVFTLSIVLYALFTGPCKPGDYEDRGFDVYPTIGDAAKHMMNPENKITLEPNRVTSEPNY